MAAPKTLSDQFDAAHANRGSFMKNCRKFSAYTIPAVLPPESQDEGDLSVDRWRDIGGVGIENMVGRLLTAIFPVGLPWFRVTPSGVALAGHARGDINDAQLNVLIDKLYQRELLILSQLETSNFRLALRAAFESLMITGNALVQFADGAGDYDWRFWRLDHWVCERDWAGNIRWLMTREMKHPDSLTDQERADAEITLDGKDEPLPLYTRCEKVSGSDGPWKMTQELNGHTIHTKTKLPRLPYIAPVYRLSPGKDWARGFIDTRYADLHSTNSLWESLILGLGNAAKEIKVVDPSEPTIRPADLTKPNGAIVHGRVQQGVVQGVGTVVSGKSQDFTIAMSGAQHIENSLGKAMLLESEAMPTGDRVTATAVMRIARELEGALGGPYAHIAKEVQEPLLELVAAKMESGNLLTAITNSDQKAMVSMELLTGASALSKQMELDKLLTAIQTLSAIPEAMQKLRLDVIADRVFQYIGVNTKGLIKTPEDVAAEFERQVAQNSAVSANDQIIKTLGTLVEQRAAA